MADPHHATGEFPVDGQPSAERKYTVPVVEGLQLHARRNLFQAVALVIFAGAGAVVGASVTDDRPDLAAVVGGILGMLAGAFVSGFVLMLLPPPTIEMTLAEIRSKYNRIHRRATVSSVVFAVVMLSLPLVIWRFGHDGSTFGIMMCIGWLGAAIGLCAYKRMLYYALGNCPRCGRPFPRGTTTCNECQFSTEAAIDDADLGDTAGSVDPK